MTAMVMLSIEPVEKLKKKVTMEFNPLANQGQGSQPLLLPPGKQPEMELKTFEHKSGSSAWQRASPRSDPIQHLAWKGGDFCTSRGGKFPPVLLQKA